MAHFLILSCLMMSSIVVPGVSEATPSKERKTQPICSKLCSELPNWLQTAKPYFNYRIRYQWEKYSQQKKTNRGIDRLLAGVRLQPQQNIELTFGISTGGDNPRTTNTTFAPHWNHPEFRLDLASFILNSNECFKFVGGKFRMADILWSPTHMLWDSDITPIGVGGSLKKSLDGSVNSLLRTGYFSVREVRFTRSAPEVFFTQAAVNWDKFTYHSESTLSFYTVPNATHNVFQYSSNSNTKKANGKNRYQFNCLSPAFEFGSNNIFMRKHAYLGAFIESIHNLNPKHKNNGFIVGLKVGQKKTPVKQGEWLIVYSYRYLEKDAWMDTFPNQRFFRGMTNVKGHRARVQFAIIDHVVLSGTYYNAATISGPKLKQQTFQFDCSIIF